MSSAEPIRDSDLQHVPYLRVLAESPYPEGPLGTRLWPGAQARPEREKSRSVAFAGVSWALWGMFLLSLGLLVVVRAYVTRAEARWTQLSVLQTDLPLIQADSPRIWTPVGALRLGWDRVPGTYLYKLRITTITGNTVVDQLPVETTSWSPPSDIFPAMGRGEYLWQVTAVGPDEKPIARSSQAMIRLVD